MSALGPNLAGTWYPGKAAVLGDRIGTLLEGEESPPLRSTARDESAELVAVVAPHAGMVYSGATAACGFRELRGEGFRRVVLLGPSHYSPFRGAALPESSHYRTPLGEVRLDSETIGELSVRAEIRIDDRPFRPEHSLEMEIPFLQATLAPGWTLVPVLLGSGSDPGSDARVAEALAPLLGSGTLFVVSTDFTHFGDRFGYVPFDVDVPQRIEALDMGAVDHILRVDAAGFEDYVARTSATICGRHALSVLLRVLPAAARPALVGYDTSGRITGDWDFSVSYASLVVDRPAAA